MRVNMHTPKSDNKRNNDIIIQLLFTKIDTS